MVPVGDFGIRVDVRNCPRLSFTRAQDKFYKEPQVERIPLKTGAVETFLTEQRGCGRGRGEGEVRRPLVFVGVLLELREPVLG